MHDAPQEAFSVIRDLEFVKRGDQAIAGDLYLPSGKPNAPVMVAIHGGAWQRGGPKSYARLGPYFARQGIAVFAITYRFSPKNLFPKAVHDARAAVQFLRAKGAGLGIDVNRIGVMGDSAGGHLASLVALAGDRPEFANQAEDAYPGVSSAVKVCVPVYGIYDLMAQWDFDQILAPKGNLAEIFLGFSALEDRFGYHRASPINYVTKASNHIPFFMAWGTRDDIVDPKTQAEPMHAALKRADFYVRTATVDAGHFWMSDPLDEPGSFPGFVAPRILRFLQEKL
jgi:acetyl esterase/lipase